MDFEKAIEFILTMQAKAEVEMEQMRASQAAAQARSDSEIAGIEAILRRAVRLGVKEARAERAKRRELDEKITQLAAAQLLTEEALQAFLKSMSRGHNGNH